MLVCISVFPNQSWQKSVLNSTSVARFGTVQLRALYEKDQSRLGSQMGEVDLPSMGI